MTYFNEFGQARLGWNVGVPSGGITPSTLWSSIYSVYNADSVGSSSLKTSLYAVYNGESNANDSFGSNNGTPQGGLTYTTGKIGNAFNLNGTNAYVSLPNNSLNFTGDFSYSAWVYFRDVPSGERFIITSTNGNGTNVNLGDSFGILSAQLTLGVYANTDSSTWKSNGILLPSTWYHVTVTKKLSNAPKFYINGTLQTTSLLAGNNTLNPIYTSGAYPNSLATIGAYRYNNGSSAYGYSNANIDAVNVWQKELTQSEITELYNAGNGAQYITNDFYKPTTNDALNTYNGTAQGGLTYGVGKVGTAFQFNGSNSLVELPTNSMKFTGDFSYSLWFNLSTISGYQTLISNYRNAGGEFGNTLIINPSGKLEVWGYANSTPSFSVANTTSFNTNTWYHVSVTKSSSSVKIYVNGVLDRTTTVGAPMVYFSTMYPSIGSLYKWNGSSSAYFMSNGSKIDAVGIWNKELTQSEITELYNAGNGKQYPN